MSAPTSASLIAELGSRMGDYIVATAAVTGTTTTLVDATLDQYITEDVTSDLNVWVYGVATTTLGLSVAVAGNRGIERRGKSYTQSSHTIGLYAAMPAVMQAGNYEIHPRHTRARKLAALNSAVRLLNLAWFRDVWDTSLTTIANQWSYTLPTSILWTAVKQVEIQMLTLGGGIAIAAAPNGATEAGNVVTITTTVPHGFVVNQTIGLSGVGVTAYNGTATITGVPTTTSFTYTSGVTGLAASGGGTANTGATYPYTDAAAWDYRIYPQVDASGNKTWTLQFGVQPPPDRTLRVIGRAAYADMANEGDILPIPDAWDEALEFVYDWAEFRLWCMEEARQPGGQTERIKQVRQDRLMLAVQQLQENRPQLPNVRVAIPGTGTGQYPSGGVADDPAYLGAFSV